MLREDVRAREPRPVQLSGLLSVMREQMLAAPNVEERFGERSYAIISDKYLNFSSRVGYHYSVLDAYCGATVNKNYITFSFKGGAADDVRRSRRVRAIAIVLMGLDFSVEVKGDRVDARLQKYEAPVIQDKLDLIGRLLIFTRQMDMLMTSEASVEAVASRPWPKFPPGQLQPGYGGHCRPRRRAAPEIRLRLIPPDTFHRQMVAQASRLCRCKPKPAPDSSASLPRIMRHKSKPMQSRQRG